MKICAECGKPFEETSFRQIICSDACRKARAKNYHSKYAYKDKEVLRQRAKMRYADKSAKHVVNCLICGKPVASYVNWDGRICRPRMHKECLVRDIRATIESGAALSALQLNRMRYWGLNKTMFIEEYM